MVRPTPVRFRLPLVATTPFRPQIPPPRQASLPHYTSTAPELTNSQVIDLINQHAPEDTSKPMSDLEVPKLVEVGLQWPSLLQFVSAAEAQLPLPQRFEVESNMVEVVAMDSAEDYVRVFDVVCAGIDRIAMVKPFLQRVAASSAPHEVLAMVVDSSTVTDVDVWLEVVSETHWHHSLTPKLLSKILAECQGIGVVGEMRRYQAMWRFAGIMVEQQAWPIVEAVDDDVQIPMTSLMCQYIEATGAQLRPFVKSINKTSLKDVIRSWQMRAKVRANVEALGPLIHYHQRYRRRFIAIIPVIIGGLIDSTTSVGIAERLKRVSRALTILEKHGYAIDWPHQCRSQLVLHLSQASRESCQSPQVRRHLEHVSEVMALRGHPVVESMLRG